MVNSVLNTVYFTVSLGSWFGSSALYLSWRELFVCEECYLSVLLGSYTYPAGNYMFKVNNKNTRTMCEICSK